MFRGARHSDLEQILDIYARARKVMAASGNPTQWGDGYPPREMLEEDIDANRLFIYTVNGRLEAVFAFILGPDPTYAKIEGGKWLNDTLPYGTIHRLASAGHYMVSRALREPARRHPRGQQDHAASSREERLCPLRHHLSG